MPFRNLLIWQWCTYCYRDSSAQLKLTKELHVQYWTLRLKRASFHALGTVSDYSHIHTHVCNVHVPAWSPGITVITWLKTEKTVIFIWNRTSTIWNFSSTPMYMYYSSSSLDQLQMGNLSTEWHFEDAFEHRHRKWRERELSLPGHHTPMGPVLCPFCRLTTCTYTHDKYMYMYRPYSM